MLTVRLFETGDAFRLVSVAGTVSQAEKRVVLQGGYESAEGGTFEFRFDGPLSDASALKAFLEPQLRAARDRQFDAAVTIRFEDGLSLKGGAAEALTERLTRLASGAAHVQASAEGWT